MICSLNTVLYQIHSDVTVVGFVLFISAMFFFGGKTQTKCKTAVTSSTGLWITVLKPQVWHSGRSQSCVVVFFVVFFEPASSSERQRHFLTRKNTGSCTFSDPEVLSIVYPFSSCNGGSEGTCASAIHWPSAVVFLGDASVSLLQL